MGFLRSILLACLLLGLGSTFVCPVSGLEWYLDPSKPAGDGSITDPFNKSDSICWESLQNAADSQNDLYIVSSTPATLDINCTLVGTWAITCSTTACSLNVGSNNIYLRSGADVRFTNAVSFVATSGTTPVFTLSEMSLLNIAGGSITTSRAVLKASEGSSVEFSNMAISVSPINPASPHVFLGNSSSTINLRGCVISAPTISAGSFFYQDNGSHLGLNAVTMANTLFGIIVEDNPVRFIYSRGMSNVIMYDCYLTDIELTSNFLHGFHPSLIDIETGTALIQASEFTSIDISCTVNCPLGSLIAIRNADGYMLQDSTFTSITSPGCNIIHVENTPGSITNNQFDYSVITGSPAPELSNGKQYPPTTLSSAQAVVCLTRTLANLEADFGVQLGSSQGGPGGTGFSHVLNSNQWQNPTYSGGHKLRDFGGKFNNVPLFAADLWASNVAVTLQGNLFSASSLKGSVRVDACQVRIQGAGLVLLGSWIDFGSRVQIAAGVLTVSASSVAIYGAAPISASNYSGLASPDPYFQITGTDATPNSVITGGVFSALKLRMLSPGKTLVLGSPFPETVALLPSAPQISTWDYNFRFVNGAELFSESGTVVDIVSLVAPLEFLGLSSSYLNGYVSAPRLGSLYSASGANVATVKASEFTLGPPSTLMVVDLCVIGDLKFEGASMKIEPSFARSTAHGLNVTGSLKGVGITVTLMQFTGSYARLPYSEISFRTRFPLITAGSVSSFPITFDTEFNASSYGLIFRTENFVTRGPVEQFNLYLSKVQVTAIPHANGAAVVARFPSVASSYEDWGIGANCSGFFTFSPPFTGVHCQWIRKRDLLIWSNSTMLPQDMTSLSLEPSWYWAPNSVQPDYEEGAQDLTPLGLFMHIPPSVPVDVSFWLDATPSYFLAWRGDEAPRIEWECASGCLTQQLTDFFDAHKNDWRIEVPANFLILTTSYSFVANIRMSDGTQIVGSVNFITGVASNCNPPNVFLDAPSLLHYYESKPLSVRVLVDPSCPANVTGPAQFQFRVDSGELSPPSSDPILILPAFSRGDKNFGTVGSLFVTVSWPTLGTSATFSSVILRYSSMAPSFQTTHLNELYATDPDQQISISSAPYQSSAGGVLTVDWEEDDLTEGFRCPVQVFEDDMDYPDPRYSPGTTHVRCFNTESAPIDLYELQYTDGAPGSVGKILRNTQTWQPGAYTMAVAIKSQQQDQTYTYRQNLPLTILPGTALGETLRRAKLFYQTMSVPLSLPYGVYPSQVLAIEVRPNSGQRCDNCTYQWNVVGPGFGVNNQFVGQAASFLTFPPNTLPFGSEITIEVAMTYPDGYATTAKALYTTQTRPYGGTFTVTPALSSNGSFDAQATRWVSEHACLQYMITEQDCNPPYAHRLVAWPTHSSNWKSLRATIRGCEAHPVLFLHVMDGIGSTTSVSVEMAGYTRPAPFWTSEQIIDLASSISDNLVSGHWDTLLKQLQWLTNIPEAIPSSWVAAKPAFVQKIENSQLWDRILALPHWPMVLHIAFGDAEVLRMLDSAFVNAKLITLPPGMAPARSVLDGYDFASRWELTNVALNATFGPHMSPTSRAANFQNWVYSPSLNTVFSSLLSLTSATSGKIGWSLQSSTMWLKVRPVDILTARSEGEWKMARSPGMGVSLSPSARSAVSGPTIVIWMQQIIFSKWTHPLMPSNPLLAPFDTALHFSHSPSFSTPVPASFLFPIAAELLNANPQLTCAYSTAFAWVSGACTTTKSTSPLPAITCECSIPGDAAVSVTVLNPGAFCPQPIPANSNFVCLNGAWVLEGNVESPVIVVPPTSVTIIGNLTVDTIQFGGLAGTVNVTGCTKIGTSITIELTLEELEALISSGEITSLLLTSTGCDISDLKNIPISVTVNGGDRCEKVTVTSETTTTTLSGVFKVDTSGCKKKSSTWWIVLVSVLGGVIVLAVVVVLLATFTPLKHIIRPHAKRAEEANTYYINDEAPK